MANKIVKVVASLLAVGVFAGGVCVAGYASRDKDTGKWFSNKDIKSWTLERETGLTVTPEDYTFGTMSVEVRAMSLSDDTEIAEISLTEDSYIATVVTPDYDGNISMSINFVGSVKYWANVDHSTDPADYLTITQIDNRNYKVTCTEAFGTPIKITFTRDDTGESAFCTCNYKAVITQPDTFHFGDNAFMVVPATEYSSAYLAVKGDLQPMKLTLNNQPIQMGLGFVSSYTVAGSRNFPPASTTAYKLEVNEAWVNLFGLSNYQFRTYPLTGTQARRNDFVPFGTSWINYAIGANSNDEMEAERKVFLSKLYYTVVSKYDVEEAMPEYFENLQGVEDGALFYADMLPAYKLTVSYEGFTETFDICLDFSELASLDLNSGIQVLPGDMTFGDNS